MSKKYSKGFERSYKFYYNNINNFTFCGTAEADREFVAISDINGRTAKECFMRIDSNGINLPCCEPELLNKLLLCKAAINFQIKQWAEGRADGTLPLVEFSKRELIRKYNPNREEYIRYYLTSMIVSWNEDGTIKTYRDIQKQYNLPDWVITAVEKQKEQILKLKLNP